MAALRRDFLPARPRAAAARRRLRRLRRRAGAADPGGDALAAGPRRPASLHRRRRGLGGPSVSGRRRAQIEILARRPTPGGHAPHRAGRAGRRASCCAPSSCAASPPPAEVGLAYDILIYTRHLPVAAEFARRLPGQRLVLDHLAKPDIRSGEIRELGARSAARWPRSRHVMAKLSGLVTEADWRAWTPEQMRPYLDVAFDCFGSERLMIGSDWPVCTVAADYARTMQVVMDYLRDRPRGRAGGRARAATRRACGDSTRRRERHEADPEARRAGRPGRVARLQRRRRRRQRPAAAAARPRTSSPSPSSPRARRTSSGRASTPAR